MIKVKHLLWSGTLLLLAIVFIFFFGVRNPPDKTQNSTVKLAECLTAKGVKMYGADWCPHCQDQKNLFGSAFKKVNYIECQQDPNACLAVGIERFPTWVFPNGARIEGVLALEKLSEISGCQLSP